MSPAHNHSGTSFLLLSGWATLLMLLVGCGTGGPNIGVLRLATTTSARDSGLLDELLPDFEEVHGCRVDVIALGSGAALKLGQAGDVDVVLVHARSVEKAFMAAGHGVRHEEFMENDFVLLGPLNDPARIHDVGVVEALKKIAAAQSTFISRGDDSGTHKREQSLWEKAGGRPQWRDYLETGQGMGPTLTIAHERRAYTLADSATYLKFRDKIDLQPLSTATDNLRNPYAAIVVNPARHKRVNARLAARLLDFLIAQRTQRRIADYCIDGQPLFRPTRLDAKTP